MMPQPRGPQGKKPRKPIDPIEQQKANIRTSLMLIAAALVIFAASSFVLSTMPLFLALFIFALAGITLSIIAIVRTAVYRGPWFFYIAAGRQHHLRRDDPARRHRSCPHARRAGVP